MNTYGHDGKVLVGVGVNRDPAVGALHNALARESEHPRDRRPGNVDIQETNLHPNNTSARRSTAKHGPSVGMSTGCLAKLASLLRNHKCGCGLRQTTGPCRVLPEA